MNFHIQLHSGQKVEGREDEREKVEKKYEYFDQCEALEIALKTYFRVTVTDHARIE